MELILEGEPAIYLADPVWRSIALSVWDSDNDGYITEAESMKGHMLNIDNFQNTGSIQILDLSKLAVTGYYNFTTSRLPNLREAHFGKAIANSPTLPYQGFMDNTSLELLDMGDYIQYTDRMLCKGATNLKKVVLSKNLIRIDAQAFMNCTSLVEVSDIPDTCTGIYGDYNNEVFRKCSSLKEIRIGSGITKIGGWTFADCTSMERFYIKATTPPAIGDNCFTNNPCTIYVPRGSGAAYKAATNWSQYASRIYEYDF